MVAIDSPALAGGLGQPSIRPYAGTDHQWAHQLLERTGGRYRVRSGRVVDVSVLPGLVGGRNGIDSTLVTFVRHRSNFEVAVIASHTFDTELAGMMLSAALEYRTPDCQRCYAITSNADFDVQRVLQTAGFRLCATRPGQIESVARRSGQPVAASFNGLVVRDEVEFDLLVL